MDVLDEDSLVNLAEKGVGKAGEVEGPSMRKEWFVRTTLHFVEEPDFFEGPVIDPRVIVVKVAFIVDATRAGLFEFLIVVLNRLVLNRGGLLLFNEGIAFEVLLVLLFSRVTKESRQKREIPNALALLPFSDSLVDPPSFHFAQSRFIGIVFGCGSSQPFLGTNRRTY